MSEIYQRFIHHSLSSYFETILSNFKSVYAKSYYSDHILISLIENCKKSLENKFFWGTVLLLLSKAFDCISHDFFVAKLHPYDSSVDAVTFVYS